MSFALRRYYSRVGFPVRQEDQHSKQSLLRQAKQARKEEEVRVGKAQMDAALAAGASWGFGEDAAEEIVEGEDVEWRTYAETHSLTEKQVLRSVSCLHMNRRCDGASTDARLHGKECNHDLSLDIDHQLGMHARVTYM